MRFDTLEYQIGALPEAPQTLTLNRLGHARYAAHTNRETIHRPEIGIYETVLPPDEVEALAERLAHPPLQDLPDHWGEVLSGDRYRRIRVVAGADTVEKFVGTRQPVDPGLQAVIDHLDRVIEQVLRHPRQTLRLGLTEVIVDADRGLTATMVLTSTGSETATIRHPLDLLGAPDGRLSIQLWPEGQDAARRLLNIAVDEIDRHPPSQRPAEAVLELPAQHAATFRIHGTLPVTEAGAYQGRVAYVTFKEQIDGRRVLLGEVTSPAIAVSIASDVEEFR